MPRKSAVAWQFELLWLLSWPKKYICHKNQLQFGSLNCFDCVGCLSCPIAQKNSLQFCSLSCLGCLSCPKIFFYLCRGNCLQFCSFRLFGLLELFPKNLLMPQKSAVFLQFELLWLLSWPKKYICHRNQLQFCSFSCPTVLAA